MNLLAAGYNDPQNSLTGSGIYLGGIGPATSLLTNVAESKLLYARVPFRKLKSGNIKYTKESDLGLSDNSEDLKNLKNNPDWSKVFRLSSKNDLSEDSISLKIGKRYTTQACTKTDFCCTFKLNTRVVNPEGSNYYYYAIAYDGTQKFGNTSGGVQACAIVSCHVTRLCHPNHDKEAKHDFTVLEIEGDFNGNNSFQIPITLAYNNGFQTLSTDQYNFSSKRENTKMIIKKGVKNLYTFGIFSRDITKDADKYNGDEDEEDEEEDEVEDKVIGKAEDKEEEKVENGSKEMEKVESEDKEEEKHESIDQEEEKNPSKDGEEESKEESKEEGKNNGDVFSEIKESDSGSASYFTPVPTLMIAYLFYLILCH